MFIFSSRRTQVVAVAACQIFKGVSEVPVREAGTEEKAVEGAPPLRITAFAVITGRVASVKQEPPLAGCPFSEGRRSRK